MNSGRQKTGRTERPGTATTRTVFFLFVCFFCTEEKQSLKKNIYNFRITFFIFTESRSLNFEKFCAHTVQLC